MAQLTKLHSLSANENKFASTPRVLPQMRGLSSLDLQFNRIAHVGAMPPNITSLHLDVNRITAISAAAIASMLRCVYLKLQYNRLRSLPTQLGQLTNIGDLRLEGNDLTELPAEIGRLSSMRQLRIAVRFKDCVGAEECCNN